MTWELILSYFITAVGAGGIGGFIHKIYEQRSKNKTVVLEHEVNLRDELREDNKELRIRIKELEDKITELTQQYLNLYEEHLKLKIEVTEQQTKVRIKEAEAQELQKKLIKFEE